MKIHPRSNSQAGQDSFVLAMTGNKKNGVYFEIGASHAEINSNTFLLETEFNWTGISLEVDEKMTAAFSLTRKNKCVCADALKFDYVSFLRENSFPKIFDYLQLDIEPARNTFRALLKFPIRKYTPYVITFEHDKYVNNLNWAIQVSAWLYLSLHGYERIEANVSPCEKGQENNSFEDWYIKKKFKKFYS
jgi:hypothetical protein